MARRRRVRNRRVGPVVVKARVGLSLHQKFMVAITKAGATEWCAPCNAFVLPGHDHAANIPAMRERNSPFLPNHLP